MRKLFQKSSCVDSFRPPVQKRGFRFGRAVEAMAPKRRPCYPCNGCLPYALTRLCMRRWPACASQASSSGYIPDTCWINVWLQVMKGESHDRLACSGVVSYLNVPRGPFIVGICHVCHDIPNHGRLTQQISSTYVMNN